MESETRALKSPVPVLDWKYDRQRHAIPDLYLSQGSTQKTKTTWDFRLFRWIDNMIPVFKWTSEWIVYDIMVSLRLSQETRKYM